MKLIEIKNNFAKLYYRPKDVKLHISDFLTVNDGNQKIIAQVISAESTSQEGTNCAVLKFTLNLSDRNEISAYNGYVPSLDAEVSKTNPLILSGFFGKKDDSFRIGEFVTNPLLDLYLDKKFFENFVYIQSDKSENTKKLIKTLSESLSSSLIIDADGSIDINAPMEFTLGEDFKLPVNFETLNYIYENDLNGLTVEQKAIVQDIVLEIQDYIKSEGSGGYIPFSTLLSVVDDIYVSDKSTGIILFRNKLLRYHQANLFASSENEFKSLIDAVDNNGAVYLNIKSVLNGWKKETINYVIDSIKSGTNIFLAVEDSYIDKELVNKLKEKHYPLTASKYNIEFANLLKGYAKNMVMFAPDEVQRNYPTYNTFLSKLNPEEFIVSGEQTFYTPIIVSPVPFGKPEQNLEPEPAPVIPDFSKTRIDAIHVENDVPVIEESIEENEDPATVEISAEPEIGEELTPEIVESVDEPSVSTIFEETVEDEIAKDVDGMFYANPPEAVEEVEEVEEIEEDLQSLSQEEELFSDEDLDMLDDLNDDVADTSPAVAEEDEAAGFEAVEEEENKFETFELEDASDIIDLENITEENLQEVVHETPALPEPAIETKAPNIPVYTTPYDENLRPDETIKVAEGNIVYHQKYGRGVVEQIISYGRKTLCSIQFDNIGRRLLDPNLADLKQV